MLDSLLLLVDAVNELGVHRSRAVPESVRELLSRFEESLLKDVFNEELLANIKSIDKRERAIHARQMQSNLAFLRHVLSAALDKEDDTRSNRWSSVEASLDEVCHTSDFKALHGADVPSFSQIAGEAESKEDQSRSTLLRTQNLLAPLLFNSNQYSSWHSAADASALLPFGIPAAAMASEGMLDLAKPGPRLALLPVNATAA